MKEKIEEIIERKLRYCPEVREADIYRVHRIRVEELKGELSTLIQEERKEAVEGFVDNIGWKKPSEVIDLADDVIDGRSLVKQMEAYLQSLDSEGVKEHEKDDTPDYTPPMDIKYKDLKDIYKPSITKLRKETK